MFGFHSSKTKKEPQPDFASLVSEHALAAPEWEAELKKHDPFKTPPLPDKIAEQIWASRPPLNAETFARYWSNAREAGTAWQILRYAKLEYDRPALPMAYPNDPLGLYAWWHRDSLDVVEFLMLLEETFDIKIPDSVSEKIFNSFTLQETAQSLIALQTVADANRQDGLSRKARQAVRQMIFYIRRTYLSKNSLSTSNVPENSIRSFLENSLNSFVISSPFGETSDMSIILSQSLLWAHKEFLRSRKFPRVWPSGNCRNL